MIKRISIHAETQNASQPPLRSPQSNSEAEVLPANFSRTHHLAFCPHCNCMTWVIMDEDGNRYCGKCKERKDK